MLLTEKLKSYDTRDRVLTIADATWAEYEELDSAEYSHYLISYLNNQITIMSPGRNHEKIAELIGILIEAYCDIKDIRYFPFGSTRLKKEGSEGKEADTGYAFVTDKEYPDLAVEVNFTSGSISDLTKYKYLKIKEVWLWQNRKIKFYYLEEDTGSELGSEPRDVRGDSYQEKVESPTLPGIKSLTLIKYLARGFVESPLDIKKDWKKQFNNA